MNAEEIYLCLKVLARQIAISKYSQRFAMKGGTVLMSMLEYNNRFDLGRQTTDIDLHVFDA